MKDMKSTYAKNNFKAYLFVWTVIVSLLLAACTPVVPVSIPSSTTSATAAAPTTAPISSSAPNQIPTANVGTEGSAAVAFVKDGNIQVWDEATDQSETIFGAGDVISLTMSDDGQVIAFLRRSVIQRSELDWYEQSALWAVDRSGKNPRELLSAEELRALLNASETDSTNFPQMEWIPQTHRLLFSGWTYFVQGEGWRPQGNESMVTRPVFSRDGRLLDKTLKVMKREYL